LDKLLISVSGIRGVVGTALTSEVAFQFAASFGTYLKKGRVAIGRDTRISGPMITSAVISGLLSTGHDVVNIGICPTPTVELAVRDGDCVGGVAVTASHNPDKYNALKLIGNSGMFLSENQGLKVKEIFEEKNWKLVTWKKSGELIDDLSWIDHHIKKILALKIISPAKIKRKKIKIVADCVGSTAALMADSFFSKLGVDYKLIYAKPVNSFPRGPEPTPENLGALCRAVKRHKADIGFAFDPDSDRLALVSEKGTPLGEEFTLTLGARYILSKEPGSLAVNLSTSLINDFIAKEAGVKIHRTKVGERNVTEKLIRTKGVVGGEGNGGLIYPKLHWGRDGFLAAAVITQYLADSGMKISELAGELPGYVMLKTKLRLSRQDVAKKIPKLEKAFPHGKVDKTDGLRISGGGWWVQIRVSNTEPIARLMAEAEDEPTAKKLIRTAKSILSKKSGGN